MWHLQAFSWEIPSSLGHQTPHSWFSFSLPGTPPSAWTVNPQDSAVLIPWTLSTDYPGDKHLLTLAITTYVPTVPWVLSLVRFSPKLQILITTRQLRLLIHLPTQSACTELANPWWLLWVLHLVGNNRPPAQLHEARGHPWLFLPELPHAFNCLGACSVEPCNVTETHLSVPNVTAPA